jgi:hypothetical protein
MIANYIMATALKDCSHYIPLALTLLSGPRLASGRSDVVPDEASQPCSRKTMSDRQVAADHQPLVTSHW